MENTRRSFLKKMTAAGIGTAGLALSSNAAATVTTETSAEKKKKPAGKDDGKLRFGFIGTGSRCHEHINNVLSIPGNKIVAICDIQAGPIQRTLDRTSLDIADSHDLVSGDRQHVVNMFVTTRTCTDKTEA